MNDNPVREIASNNDPILNPRLRAVNHMYQHNNIEKSRLSWIFSRHIVNQTGNALIEFLLLTMNADIGHEIKVEQMSTFLVNFV